MVYTIFTNEGAFTFDTLADLFDGADHYIQEYAETWNGFIVDFQEGVCHKKFHFLDNGRDIYRDREGKLLEKMISRFILEPIS